MFRPLLSAVVVVASIAPLTSSPASAQAGCVSRSTPASVVGTPATDGEAPFLNPGNDPVNKVCIYICSRTGNLTDVTWGMGSSCNNAYNDLTNHISADASSIGPGICDYLGAISYCGFEVVITGSCHWDAGIAMYVTDGRGDIKCKDWC